MSGVNSGTNKIWAELGANKNGAAALRPLIVLKISDGYFRAPRDGLIKIKQCVYIIAKAV